nr:hypothetical protein [Tanacetum cinerariifolium]
MDDDDDWDDDVEWLMAPITPPRATVNVSSTYEVGGPSTAAVEGMSFSLPAPGLIVPPTVIEDLMATMEEQVQILQTALHGTELQNQQLRTRVAEIECREGTMMSYMLWMEERLTILEKRLSGQPSGP